MENEMLLSYLNSIYGTGTTKFVLNRYEISLTKPETKYSHTSFPKSHF